MKTLTLALLFSLLGLPTARSEVKTVPNVDLDRYVGKWHEIASIPQSFQKQCVGDVTAEYSKLEDGRIKVVNSCRKGDGTFSVSEGRAKVVDEETRSKLKVTFVKFIGWIFAFGGKYWVIDLAPDYSFAVVGHPEAKYGWILSRSPSLAPDVLAGIEQRLRAQGYDTCQFLTTIQAGGLQEKKPLCKAVPGT